MDWLEDLLYKTEGENKSTQDTAIIIKANIRKIGEDYIHVLATLVEFENLNEEGRNKLFEIKSNTIKDFLRHIER